MDFSSSSLRRRLSQLVAGIFALQAVFINEPQKYI